MGEAKKDLEGPCSIQLSYGAADGLLRQRAPSIKGARHENRVRVEYIVAKRRALIKTGAGVKLSRRFEHRLRAGFEAKA